MATSVQYTALIAFANGYLLNRLTCRHYARDGSRQTRFLWDEIASRTKRIRTRTNRRGDLAAAFDLLRSMYRNVPTTVCSAVTPFGPKRAERVVITLFLRFLITIVAVRSEKSLLGSSAQMGASNCLMFRGEQGAG